MPYRVAVIRGVLLVALLGQPVFKAEAHSSHEHHNAMLPTIEVDPAMTVSPARLGSQVTLQVQGDRRIITANGLPDHEPGRFPNRNNPNAISAQSYRFLMPLNPVANDRPSRGRRALFGVALNGVPFDPGTAENWTPDGLRRGGPPSEWVYEALSGQINLGVDDSLAHVQPTGAYHYHGLPHGLIEIRGGSRQVVLLGYAADGFPIYGPFGYEDPADPDSQLVELRPSYRVKQGTRPSGDAGPGGRYDGTFTADYEYVEGLGDLDECNGRFGVTPDYPDGTYYYVLTEAFPHVPRSFRGTPDASFSKRGGPGGSGGPGNRPPRGERPPR